jgi:hypothetical protein
MAKGNALRELPAHTPGVAKGEELSQRKAKRRDVISLTLRCARQEIRPASSPRAENR